MGVVVLRMCFVLDANMVYLRPVLAARGFPVLVVGRDLPAGSHDYLILHVAERLGCAVVSHDKDFRGERCAVYVPLSMRRRRNRKELAQYVIKMYPRECLGPPGRRLEWPGKNAVATG